MDLHDREPAVAPLAAAGVLLAARTLGADLGLRMPTVAGILQATGGTRSRAYEVSSELVELLPSLIRPRGRPLAAAEDAPLPDTLRALCAETLRFVMAHPGCVIAGPQRTTYADTFRRFVLELREHHPDVPSPSFAEAIGVPLGTVEDWLRSGRREEPPPQPEREPDLATVAQVETVLDAWSRWHGKELGPFVTHLREHLHVPFGPSAVARILFEHGERTPRRRAGRCSADESALRDAFETFFPSAQWVGDGTEVVVTFDGEPFRFNLELLVDAHTGAWVGIDVRDAEDSDAVIAAFAHGAQTTGDTPLALLLDNKPCNHTEEVDQALRDTLRIRSTLGRAQNKAHVEGAFGLFEQQAPPIIVHSGTRRELARQFAQVGADHFARGINGRPRRDRGGKSRIDLHDLPVTDAVRELARAQLQARLDKQERARQTRQARRDPLVAAYLDHVFDRLGLLDPERRARDALATHALDSVVDAVAIFERKRHRGSLPDGADVRYLLGIVKNLDHVHESDAITEALLRERLDMRDRLLEPLRVERDKRLEGAPSGDALRAFTDRALAADRTLEEHFWLDAVADLIRDQPDDAQQALFRSAARRIHATFRVSTTRRSTAERRLLRRIWPLD